MIKDRFLKSTSFKVDSIEAQVICSILKIPANDYLFFQEAHEDIQVVLMGSALKVDKAPRTNRSGVIKVGFLQDLTLDQLSDYHKQFQGVPKVRVEHPQPETYRIARRSWQLFKMAYPLFECQSCKIKATKIKLKPGSADSNLVLTLVTSNGMALTKDHIVPRIRGGANNRENLQVLCTRRNSAKGASVAGLPTEFRSLIEL